jgi:hypothetical protein
VVFVDPEADLKRQLEIEQAERLVIEGDPRAYFFVRVRNRSAADRIELSLQGTAGRFTLPREQISSSPCDLSSTCFAAALPPGVPSEADEVILSVFDIGHEDRARLVKVPLSGYGLTAEALAGNAQIRATIEDPIALHLARENAERSSSDPLDPRRFPRAMEALVEPGGCGAEPSASDPRWQQLRSDRFTLETESFSAASDPTVCLSVRPAEPIGGGTVARASVPARALILSFDHVYSPPVETSPFVFLILFDLEIPNEGRCAEAEQLLVAAIRDAAIEIATRMETPSEVRMLEPVRIAVRDGVPCRQLNERRLDPVLPDRVAAQIDALFGPDRRVRLLLAYVSNLDLAPPPELVADFASLRARFDPALSSRRAISIVSIAPERAATPLDADLEIPFSATAEPAFRDSIRDTLRSLVWPFRTVLHTNQTVVPLIAEEDRARFQLFRICSASLPIEPAGERVEAVFRPEDGVPGYRVPLQAQILEPPPSFAVPSVRVRWQGCEGLCDRAAPGHTGSSSWVTEEGC